jgi:hypothetical protein
MSPCGPRHNHSSRHGEAVRRPPSRPLPRVLTTALASANARDQSAPHGHRDMRADDDLAHFAPTVGSPFLSSSFATYTSAAGLNICCPARFPDRNKTSHSRTRRGTRLSRGVTIWHVTSVRGYSSLACWRDAARRPGTHSRAAPLALAAERRSVQRWAKPRRALLPGLPRAHLAAISRMNTASPIASCGLVVLLAFGHSASGLTTSSRRTSAPFSQRLGTTAPLHPGARFA